MKIQRIKLHNFMSYKSATITFSKDGIVILYGHNKQSKESIGIGKSAIKEALLFVLFGKTKFKELDEVISFNEVSTNVELEFSFNDISYKIVREKTREKTPKVKFNDIINKLPLTCETNTLTQKAIEKTLGIDYERFCLIYCFGQSEYDNLKELQKGKLIDLFLNTFDLTKFDNINNDLKEQCLKYEQKLVKLNTTKEIYAKNLKQQKEKQRIGEQYQKCLENRVGKVKSIFDQYSNKLIIQQDYLKLLENRRYEIVSQMQEVQLSVHTCEEQLERIKTIQKCPTCLQDLTVDTKKSLSTKLSTERINFKKKLDTLRRDLKQEDFNLNCVKHNIVVYTGKNKQSEHILFRLKTILSLSQNVLHEPTINIDDISKEIETTIEKINTIKETKNIFSRKGFSYFILQRELPELEILINHYLAYITDFMIEIKTEKKLKTKDETKLELSLTLIKDGNTYSLHNLSNGQECLINLCIRLGLSELFTRRFNKNLGTLIIDDEFGKIDGNTNLTILGLLYSLIQKGFYKNIILMTHSSEIKDNIDPIFLARKVEIEMSNGQSKIKENL